MSLNPSQAADNRIPRLTSRQLYYVSDGTQQGKRRTFPFLLATLPREFHQSAMEWPLSPESNGSAYDEQNYATHPNANAWKRASLPLSNADFKNDMAQGHPGGLLPRAQQRTRKEGPILAELRTNLVVSRPSTSSMTID